VLRRLARIIAALLVVAVAAAAGVYVAAGLAPERLRAEVERLLTMATEGPVSMGNLRLVVGFPLHLDARDLRIWGGALTVERASARIDVFALVTGRVRLSRLSLDGAHLRIQRGSDGSWSPPWLQRHTPAPEPAPEPALMPLLTIDAVVRFLLERPLLADTLQVARSRVSYVHDFSDSGGAVVALWLEGVHGRLQHSRLLGDAELSLHARLVAEDGPGGSFEWEGARTRKTGMRLTMAATEFELETLVPFLTPGPSPGQLSGRLSGVIDYTVAESEQGRLDLDLVTRDFGLGAGLASADPFAADHLATRMRVHIDPHHLEVSRARIQRGDLEFDLEAVVSRPLGRDSNTALTLSMQDVDLARARGLIEWLPEATRDEASAVADSVLAGRIPSMQAHGAARLEDWQGLMTGSAKVLPRALRIAVDVEDVAIAVDESDRLEHVTGTLAWSEDRLTAHHVNGDLNGEPLPTLDLEISGIGHLLASERRWRLIPSGAVPLAGLTPLWEFLQPADPESESMAPTYDSTGPCGRVSRCGARSPTTSYRSVGSWGPSRRGRSTRSRAMPPKTRNGSRLRWRTRRSTSRAPPGPSRPGPSPSGRRGASRWLRSRGDPGGSARRAGASAPCGARSTSKRWRWRSRPRARWPDGSRSISHTASGSPTS
jgi:hypothetical protein